VARWICRCGRESGEEIVRACSKCLPYLKREWGEHWVRNISNGVYEIIKNFKKDE